MNISEKRYSAQIPESARLEEPPFASYGVPRSTFSSGKEEQIEHLISLLPPEGIEEIPEK